MRENSQTHFAKQRAVLLAAGSRSGATNLLFPPRCCHCHGSMQLAAELICKTCQEEVSPNSTSSQSLRCYCCGTGLPNQHVEYGIGKDCPACRQEKLKFDRCVTLGKYVGELRSAVLLAKRSDRELLARGLGVMLAKRLIWENERLFPTNTESSVETLARDLLPEVLVPVPMHWLKRLIRGNNSAESIAGGLASGLNAARLPFLPAGLLATRWTQTQSKLGKTARRRNMRDAFKANTCYDFSDRHVGLIDDIFTTGFTAASATRALQAAGARRVTLLVASRANDPI